MALQDVVTAVSDRIGPGSPTNCPIFVGKQYLAQADSPPRIIFVPSRDKFGPAERIGGIKNTTNGSQRTLLTRVAGVQIHVWAADVPTTEALAHLLLAAIYAGIANDLDATKISAGGFELVEGGWLDQAWTNAGQVWICEARFKFPVLEAQLPTAVVTSIPETGELETPGAPPTEEQG